MRRLMLEPLPSVATELTQGLWRMASVPSRVTTTTLNEVGLQTLKPQALARTRPLQPRRPAHLSALPQRDTYVIRGADLKRRDVMLPFGLPAATTRVRAGTLKRLVGAALGEQLLKKVGEAWIFVPKNEMVDLTDESVQYRLGTLSILS